MALRIAAGHRLAYQKASSGLWFYRCLSCEGHAGELRPSRREALEALSQEQPHHFLIEPSSVIDLTFVDYPVAQRKRVTRPTRSIVPAGDLL